MTRERTLAVIPARSGSTGLPGKNIRPLAGLPLIAHSIRLAKLCPEIDRCVVSTDSEEIAQVARSHGGDTPFLRPADISRSETPMWPVLKHALAAVEAQEGRRYDYLMLLDPTSPTRLPEDVTNACKKMKATKEARCIVAVSKPHFNPVWHSVVEKDGWMTHLFPEAVQITRRQDAPEAYRVNGLLYIWRADFIRARDDWRDRAKHLMLIVPELRAASLDSLEEFRLLELAIRGGLIQLPWLKEAVS